VTAYNTSRTHQSCGGCLLAERFQLAGRNRAAIEVGPVSAAAAPPAGTQRAAGVSQWVDAHGTISLGGFTYAVGASYVGKSAVAVVVGGLVAILHAGVVIATHAQLQKCWFFSGGDLVTLRSSWRLRWRATESPVLVLWRSILAIYTYE
jgi:hypothetical protein